MKTKNTKPERLNASQLLFLLKGKGNTYNRAQCEIIVMKYSNDIDIKHPVANVHDLEKHTGAMLQFGIDELWNNFGRRKNAMSNIYQYPVSKLYIKDAEKIPKTISFPKALKSFLPASLVDEIVNHWSNEYSGFDVLFKA